MPSADPRLAAVVHTQHRFWSALQAKDAALFEHVLSPEFISRSPGQPGQDRADFIANLTGFPANVNNVRRDNLAVHFFGEVAVITGVQSTQWVLPNGQVVGNAMALTNVLQPAGPGWRMVLAHSVELR